MSCPDCGSGQAVPKWEAWDAACEVPPKKKEQLESMRAALHKIACMSQSKDLLWWQIEARKTLTPKTEE